MGRLSRSAIVGGTTLLAGWVAWGLYSTRSAESVPYERLRTLDGVELRRYPQTVLAETTAPDQRTAFRRLFRYISGANDGDESVSMTAPVETQRGESVAMTAPVRSDSGGADDEMVQMSFYLPAEYTPDTAPEPADPEVGLLSEPSKTVAVKGFSWYAPAWRVARQERKLLSALETEGLEPQGDPTLLRYNDPWTPPFMRRNEVAIEVVDGS